MEQLKIKLTGRFSITDEADRNHTPSGAKQQGLLALLATSPGLERGRTWIQDKLWSDRGPEQGASSLRQALHSIRRSFSPYGDILGANRTSIWLDPTRVHILKDSVAGEFLEGLDVRDNEFEAWLISMRARNEVCSSPVTVSDTRTGTFVRSVFLNCLSEGGTLQSEVERRFADQIFLSLKESQSVDVSFGNEVLAGSLLIDLHSLQLSDIKMSVRLTLEEPQNNHILMSEQIVLSDPGQSLELPVAARTLCNRLLEKVQDHAALKLQPMPIDMDASLLANIAVRKIFSLEKNGIATAEDLLEKAFSIEARGVFHAWHAQALVIKHVEGFSSDAKDLNVQADSLCRSALALEPTNSNVLAAVANVRCMIDRNVTAGLELAKLAIGANPGNPLAWWAVSNSASYGQRNQLAYQSAIRAQDLAQNTRFRFWTDIRRALSAISVGKREEAVTFCERSAALAPNFRPPKRYLTALYADLEDVEKAHSVMKSLDGLEDSPSLDRMRLDPEYPVGLMRLTGLSDSLNKIN